MRQITISKPWRNGVSRRKNLQNTIKKGAVMPLVLCFLCLTHLIYMGLLQHHQGQLLRLKEYQQYYQSQIQRILAFHGDSFIDKTWRQYLDTYLQDTCHQMFQQKKNSDHWVEIESHPQWRLSMMEDQGSFLLETIDVYLDVPKSEMRTQDGFIEFSGSLHQGLAQDNFQDVSWQNQVDHLMKEFDTSHWEMERLPTKTHREKITEMLPDVAPIFFNSGRLYVTPSKQYQQYNIVSELNSGFYSQEVHQLRQAEVLFKWSGRLYTIKNKNTMIE